MPGDLTDIVLVVAALGVAALLGAIGGVVFARLAGRRRVQSYHEVDSLLRPPVSGADGRSRTGGAPSERRGKSGAGWGAYGVPRHRKRSLFTPPPPPPPPATGQDDIEVHGVPLTMTVSFHDAMERNLPMGPLEAPDDRNAILRLPSPQTENSTAATPFAAPGLAATGLDVPTSGFTVFRSASGGSEQPAESFRRPIPGPIDSPTQTGQLPTEFVDPTLPVIPSNAEWHDVQASLRIRLEPSIHESEPPFRTLQIVGIGIEDGRRVILASDGPLCATEAIAIDDIADSVDVETLLRIEDPWNWLKAREWRPDLPLSNSPAAPE